MPRFAVDSLDLLLDLLRTDLLGVQVMSRIPDHIEDYLPLVVIRRTGGESVAPEFYDEPLINVQCWCGSTAGSDPSRAAADLADQVRGILWTAYRTQRVVPGRGWLVAVRESTGPLEVSDGDRPFLGRYTATYDLRVRPTT